MYDGYNELSQLPADAYLEWRNFAVAFDSLPGNLEKAKKAYQRGLKIGQDFDEITLSIHGVWGAHKKNSDL